VAISIDDSSARGRKLGEFAKELRGEIAVESIG
jgi:hypothetical protein